MAETDKIGQIVWIADGQRNWGMASKSTRV
jgi:hypothetical protein